MHSCQWFKILRHVDFKNAFPLHFYVACFPLLFSEVSADCEQEGQVLGDCFVCSQEILRKAYFS